MYNLACCFWPLFFFTILLPQTVKITYLEHLVAITFLYNYNNLNGLIFQTLKEYFFGEEPPLIGEMLTNKAVILRNMDKLEEAEEAYKK